MNMKKALLLILMVSTLSTAFSQKWYQIGFKISTSFLLNRDYSNEGDYINGLMDADFGLFFRAGKYVYGEVGLGYAFYKGDYSNELLGYRDVRVETRHLQLPVKIVGNVEFGRVSSFLPFVGIIYQPIIQVTDNEINFDKNTLNKNKTLLTTGFDFKFGPIVLGVNYRYGLMNFFQNKEGKHPQYINICAGFQF